MGRPVLLVDLDGTYVDTFPDLARAAGLAAEAHGLPIRLTLDAPPLRVAAGGGAAAMLRALTGLDELPAAATATMIDLYAADIAGRSRVFAGAESWAAHPVAVVTNKPLRLAARLLGRLFERPPLLCTPETAGAPKPAAAMMFEAVRRLGAEPADAVVVGDDPRDEAAAAAAGMRFVAAAWGYAPPETWAGRRDIAVLAAPRELLDLVAR